MGAAPKLRGELLACFQGEHHAGRPRVLCECKPGSLDGDGYHHVPRPSVDRTASQSGGRRDIRADLKTCAAERIVAIPDIAMPTVRRLAENGAAGRVLSEGRLYSRLINGERGGYLGYALWRRYLKLGSRGSRTISGDPTTRRATS